MASNSSALILPAPVSASNTVVEADIRDIKAPVEIPSEWFWLWCALGALACAALAYAVLRSWRKLRARSAAPAIIVPPHVRARNKLREALALIHQPKPFCILVSDTLRIYLEERFEFHAPERTTEEFLAELQSSPSLSSNQKLALGEFLMRCDLVKFARYEPGEPELRDLFDAAMRLVDETAPRPSPNTGSGIEVEPSLAHKS